MLCCFDLKLRWRTWPNEITHFDFLAVRSNCTKAALNFIRVERLPTCGLRHLHVILNAAKVHVALVVLVVVRNHLPVELLLHILWQLLHYFVQLHLLLRLIERYLVLLIHSFIQLDTRCRWHLSLNEFQHDRVRHATTYLLLVVTAAVFVHNLHVFCLVIFLLFDQNFWSTFVCFLHVCVIYRSLIFVLEF